MEEAEPDALAHAIGGNEADHQQTGPKRFDQYHQQGGPFGQADETGKAGLVHAVTNEHPAAQRNAPSQRHHAQRGEDHEAQTAHLDEYNDDTVAESGVAKADIHDVQARNAYGRGCGKGSPQKTYRLAGRGADGQGQQQAAHHNSDQKAQRQHLLRGKVPLGCQRFAFRFRAVHRIPPTK